MIEATEALFKQVIGLAIEVHRTLGPGLLESIYELALCQELRGAGLVFERQKHVKICYKSQALGIGFRADVIVDNSLLLELKAVDHLMPQHTAQVISYLNLLGIKRGLLLNFNAPAEVRHQARLNLKTLFLCVLRVLLQLP